MLDLAELLVRRGANSSNVDDVEDGGVARACDLAAAAAMLEPGARSEEAVREHCGAAAAGASAAAVTADTRGGGACAMLVPFPALAAHSKVDDDGACLVTLPAGTTRLGGPPGQQRAQPAQGVIVPRGASLRVVGARGAVGSILDAAGVGRHFLVASGSLTLEKVRLEYYCTAAHSGTPVKCAHASSQVALENGRALLSSGGAVLLLHNATLRAKETGFVRNRAALGSAGAVMCRAAASVDLDDVLFANNAATLRGGAIAIDVPPGGPPTELRLHGLRWMNNRAQRGGDDAQVCGADVGLDGARAVGCDGGSASSDVEEGAGGALFGGAMLTAVESQLEGLEALDVKGLEPAALNLLRRARAADPASPNALGTLASMLYNHARDDEARAELGEFVKHHGPHPTADSVRVMLEHKSAAALAQRALRLNGQVARMRQGRDVAVAFASRDDAQDAAIESFARAIALDPQNGVDCASNETSPPPMQPDPGSRLRGAVRPGGEPVQAWHGVLPSAQIRAALAQDAKALAEALPGQSFWIEEPSPTDNADDEHHECSAPPRCTFERIALQVMRFHVARGGADVRNSRSRGAEWWVQVRHSDGVPTIKLHFDHDEELKRQARTTGDSYSCCQLSE